MKRLQPYLVTVALLIILGIIGIFGIYPVVAATYEFYFPITATDNSGSARAYLPVFTGFTGQAFIDAGYTTSAGTDTNMQEGSNNRKYMLSTDNVVMVIVSLPAYGQVTHSYYTGYSPVQTLFAIITGSGGYITTSDDADAEHSDNFSDEVDAYFNTTNGTDKYVLQKARSYEMQVDNQTSGKVHYTVYADATSDNQSSQDSLQTISNASGVSMAGIRQNSFIGMIDDVWFYLKKTGSPTGTANITVRKVSDDSVIGRVGTLDVSTLTTSLAWKRFATTVPVFTSQDIYVSFDWVGGDGGNNVLFGYENSDAESNSLYSYYDGAWNDQSAQDATYRMDYSPLARVTDTGATSSEYDYTITYVPNLLSNSSFETNNPPTGWTAGGAGVSWNRTAAQAYAGTYSGILTRNGTDCYVYQDFFVAGMAGKPASGGIWVKATEANAVKVRFADGVNPYTDGDYHTGGGDWEWLTVEATVGAGASEAILLVWIETTDTSAYIDGAYATDAADAPTDYNTLRLYRDSAERDTAYTEIEAADNGNDIVWAQNDSVIYANSYSMTIGGNEIIRYEPTEMLSGTTLPDEKSAGGSNDGIITWGSNPANVTVTYGAPTAYVAESGANVSASLGFDMPTAPMPNDWFAAGSALSNLPFYTAFASVSTDVGIPVQSIYLMTALLMASAIGLWVVIKTRSMLIGLLMMGVILWAAGEQTVVPQWMTYTYLVIAFGIMFLYGKVQQS